MAKIWTTVFHRPAFHNLLKPDEEIVYGHKCLCCDGYKTVVIDKASRKGWMVRCSECGAIYYVPEEK
jgi:hypothetical protein